MDEIFGDRAVVGMVHLPPLPGSPRFDGDGGSTTARAGARRGRAGQ